VFNTAIALGRLGAPSAFFSGVSTDMLGEILAETLAASQRSIPAICAVGRPTTVAFVKLVNGQATYAFYDEGTAGRMLSVDQLPTCRPGVVGAVLRRHQPGQRPRGQHLRGLQAREAAARVTMIDPNIRPGFIAGKEADLPRPDRTDDRPGRPRQAVGRRPALAGGRG
jgi:fructokinase